MPLYDFLCPACQHRFTDLARVDEVISCRLCGVETNHVVSRFGIGCTEEERFDSAVDRLERADTYAEAGPLARELGKSIDESLGDVAENALDDSL